jgi:type IV pilus assembly protein PilC
MALAMVTVVILAGYVLPQFKPLFQELNADLPFSTRMLMGVATLFSTLWYIPFSVFMMILGIFYWLFKTPSGRQVKDRMVLRLPVIKGIIEYSILERFCRILGAMVSAGVPLPEGMKTTTEATSNSVFRERLELAQIEMVEGGGFSKPLAATELFPGAAKQMFKVGEETGTLDQQLEMASLYFDRELESRIKKFTTMFQPIMIIFVGLIVGFVAVALVQAMYGVLDGAKGGAG